MGFCLRWLRVQENVREIKGATESTDWGTWSRTMGRATAIRTLKHLGVDRQGCGGLDRRDDSGGGAQHCALHVVVASSITVTRRPSIRGGKGVENLLESCWIVSRGRQYNKVKDMVLPAPGACSLPCPALLPGDEGVTYGADDGTCRARCGLDDPNQPPGQGSLRTYSPGLGEHVAEW